MSCSGIGTRITRPQRAMPELLPVTFEAEDRVVGWPTSGLGIIAPAGALLMAIESQNHRIQMEHQGAPGLGKFKQRAAKLIVQARHLANGLGGQALQEPAQA